MNPNFPNGPREIIHYPENKFQKKIVDDLTSLNEYKEAKTFRIQVHILIEFSRDIFDRLYKLTYQDVANMFEVSVPIIKRGYMNGKKDVDELSKPNGRPFTLSKAQLSIFSEWYKSNKEPPNNTSVKTFISNEAGASLDYKTYKNAITKAGLKIDSAEKIDANRYYCSSNSIDYYYAILEAFFSTHNIPSAFVFNVDEEEHDEYVDTKEKELVVVPKEWDKKLFFPVQRKDDHTTFVACIAADGSYLKPLIVVKRKTIEARILRLSVCDKVKIKFEETGYINSEVFNAWVNDVFIPEVIKRRRKFNYTGPAVLIIDGCPSHYTKVLFDSCDANNVKIIFIPPHSSNQTQMLDLSMFHIHKENVRQARLFDIDNTDLLMDKIEMLFDSFHRTASPPKIKAFFAAAGAVYEVCEHYQYFPIIQERSAKANQKQKPD